MTDRADLTAVVDERGGHVILRLTGELDRTTAPVVRAAIAAAVPPARHILIDLSGVGFCDSSGIGVLVWSYRYASERDCFLGLRDLQPPVARFLVIAGIDAVIPITPAP